MEVFLLFKENAGQEDVLRGLTEAFLVRSLLYNSGGLRTSSNSDSGGKSGSGDARWQRLDLLQQVHEFTKGMCISTVV